jgi:hypothetical protein
MAGGFSRGGLGSWSWGCGQAALKRGLAGVELELTVGEGALRQLVGVGWKRAVRPCGRLVLQGKRESLGGGSPGVHSGHRSLQLSGAVGQERDTTRP